MAFTAYHNIDGSDNVTAELLAPGNGDGNISSITITNVDNAVVTVSLFIQKLSANSTASSTFYIIKEVKIPTNSSFLLDNPHMLTFDNSIEGFGLYISVGASDVVDVLISLA